MSGPAIRMPTWLIAVIALEAVAIVIGGGFVALFVAGLGGNGWVTIAALFIAVPLVVLVAITWGVRRLLAYGRLLPAVLVALLPMVLIVYLARILGLA